jgi:hypothetical protein
MKAALMNPTGPPTSLLRGKSMSITARALVARTWRLDVTAPCGGGRVARISGSVKARAVITASWNGRLADGTLARPGRYTLTLTSSSSKGSARSVAYPVLVLPPAPATETPGTPLPGTGGGYQPVTPTRLLDTRLAGGIGLGPAGRVDIPVLGRAGVPSTAVTAVVLNLTASCASDDTALSVWATGRPSNRPVTDVPAGVTRSVLVTSRIGANGAVSVGNARGVTELTADVVGYYTAGASPVQTISSTRLYDSGADPAGKLVADEPRLIPLPATLGGVPVAQIRALVLDVSALSPTGAGTLTAYEPGAAGDLPSLSYRKGESIDNLAIAPVSGAAIVLKASGTPVDALLDVRAVIVDPSAGGTTFAAVKPVLALDTGSTSPVKAGSPRKVIVVTAATGVPAGARAVLIDLTAVDPSAKTELQAYPWGQSTPGGTALRLAAGDTRGNLVIVPIGTGGAITVKTSHGSTRMRVDVHGYFQ